eukprot:530817-Rhodomonas_salina.2
MRRQQRRRTESGREVATARRLVELVPPSIRPLDLCLRTQGMKIGPKKRAEPLKNSAVSVDAGVHFTLIRESLERISKCRGRVRPGEDKGCSKLRVHGDVV